MTSYACVCLNGWQVDEDGNETYADTDATNWCVYARTAPTPGGEYFVSDQVNFDSYSAACAYAANYARELGAELREY